MDISDEDADALLLSLIQTGFAPPFSTLLSLKAEGGFEVESMIQWNANRDAVRRAMENTEVWSRYRIY